MKKLCILFFVFSLLSCSQKRSEASETNDAPKEHTANESTPGAFDWILGAWQRTNNEEGQLTFETWEKLSDSEYQGIGYTLQAGDTVSQEVMRFFKKEEKWVLAVSLPDEPAPTLFTEVNVGDDAFTFENPANEFPSTIRYWKEDQKMMASIFNDAFEISFIFERIEE